MKKMFPLVAFSFFILLIGSCTKDRVFDPNDLNTTPPAQTDTLTIITGTSGQHIVLSPGDLVINEFVATGSSYPNELGAPGDWVELYNSRTDSIIMLNGYWYVTDSLEAPSKFHIPQTVKIAPHGYLMLQCDGADSCLAQVHTSFKLSASGEDLGLFYSSDGVNFHTIDSYSFGVQTGGISFGRITDGSNTWTTLAPTPNAANHE